MSTTSRRMASNHTYVITKPYVILRVGLRVVMNSWSWFTNKFWTQTNLDSREATPNNALSNENGFGKPSSNMSSDVAIRRWMRMIHRYWRVANACALLQIVCGNARAVTTLWYLWLSSWASSANHSKVMAGSLVTFKAKLDHHLRNVMGFV